MLNLKQQQTCLNFVNYIVRLIFFDSGSNRNTTKRVWPNVALPKNGIDQWYTGYFDISLGDFQIKFVSGDLLTAAIDDIQMIPGMCNNVCTYRLYNTMNIELPFINTSDVCYCIILFTIVSDNACMLLVSSSDDTRRMLLNTLLCVPSNMLLVTGLLVNQYGIIINRAVRHVLTMMYRRTHPFVKGEYHIFLTLHFSVPQQ